MTDIVEKLLGADYDNPKGEAKADAAIFGYLLLVILIVWVATWAICRVSKAHPRRNMEVLETGDSQQSSSSSIIELKEVVTVPAPANTAGQATRGRQLRRTSFSHAVINLARKNESYTTAQMIGVLGVRRSPSREWDANGAVDASTADSSMSFLLLNFHHFVQYESDYLSVAYRTWLQLYPKPKPDENQGLQGETSPQPQS